MVAVAEHLWPSLKLFCSTSHLWVCTADGGGNIRYRQSLNENEGVTFLLAEQNTSVALRYATYGYILENGRVVMDGKAAELNSNEDVKEFYLESGEVSAKAFVT